MWRTRLHALLDLDLEHEKNVAHTSSDLIQAQASRHRLFWLAHNMVGGDFVHVLVRHLEQETIQYIATGLSVNEKTRVIVPDDMRRLTLAFPKIEKECGLWKYNEIGGDFVQVTHRSSRMGLLLKCVMNPRELCSAKTMLLLGPLIISELTDDPYRVLVHALLYKTNIVDRVYE